MDDFCLFAPPEPGASSTIGDTEVRLAYSGSFSTSNQSLIANRSRLVHEGDQHIYMIWLNRLSVICRRVAMELALFLTARFKVLTLYRHQIMSRSLASNCLTTLHRRIDEAF